MEYAKKLYEQFTGSYSKKTSRLETESMTVEKLEQTSPHKTRTNVHASPIRQKIESDAAKLLPASQISNIIEKQKDFLQIHNDLLQEINKKKIHAQQQAQGSFININDQVGPLGQHAQLGGTQH